MFLYAGFYPTEWLASKVLVPGTTEFSKPMEKMKNWTDFARLRRWHIVSLQKFNEIHLRAAIDRFLRSLPLNKLFSVISDPTFTKANKALDCLQNTSEKRATLPAN